MLYSSDFSVTGEQHLGKTNWSVILWILSVVLEKAPETFDFISFYFCLYVYLWGFWCYMKIVGP